MCWSIIFYVLLESIVIFEAYWQTSRLFLNIKSFIRKLVMVTIFMPVTCFVWSIFLLLNYKSP